MSSVSFKPPITETVDSSGNIVVSSTTIPPPPAPSFSLELMPAGTVVLGAATLAACQAAVLTLSPGSGWAIVDSTGLIVSSGTTPIPPPSPVVVMPPVLTGWGGIRADKLPGNAAALQSQFSLMQKNGYNCARIWIFNEDFGVTATVDQAKQAVDIARSFGFWVIIDWHGFGYPDWSKWLPYVQALTGYYDKILWEPMNEPGGDDGSVYTTKLMLWQIAYQTWINNCRALGDTHFIIVDNVNWLDISHAGTGYAPLTDPLNALYASFHDYYFFKYHTTWTMADADSFAAQYLAQVDLAHNQPWAHRFITTELGADTGCNASKAGSCPADQIIGGSAGYAPESLEFVKKVIAGLKSRGYSYILWPGGDWTDTPGAGATGAMAVWGQLLGTTVLPPPPTPAPAAPPGGR